MKPWTSEVEELAESRKAHREINEILEMIQDKLRWDELTPKNKIKLRNSMMEWLKNQSIEEILGEKLKNSK